MTFLTRDPKLVPTQQPQRNYGRGTHADIDYAKAEQKANQQQMYKQELQRQIQEKEQRKKLELEKIRKEDEKFMREVEEQQRKEAELKKLEKEKLRKLEESVASPPAKKNNPIKQYKSSRVLAGTLNVSLKQPNPMPPTNNLPRLGFNSAYNESQPNTYSAQRIRPYLYEQNEQINTYYEQRIRKHKQQMNLKIDELFHHINSTKDNIRAQEEIQKIKKKLRAKQIPYVEEGRGGDSRVQLDYQNKFFHIPKRNSQVYRKENDGRSRVLDYQSISKFKAANMNQLAQSSSKSRTQVDQMYNLPTSNYSPNDQNDKWGIKPGKDNYLSNREAIDFQAESILGRIDDFLGKLKN